MALNYRIKLLMWLNNIQNRKTMDQMSPDEAREDYVMTLRKTRRLMEYKPVEMHKISNRFVETADYKVPVRIYQPFEGDQLPILMYFHGGGFVIGNLDTHEGTCRRLSQLIGCIVIAVDYRLAPEHKYPIAPNDCYAATKWAAENASDFNGDPDRIAVSGDSAGGNLAAVVSLMARDLGGPKIIYQGLIYPTTDGTFGSASIDRLAEGYLLTKDLMTWFREQYRDKDTELKDPYFSPYFADDLSGLPPALIITAEFDPLVDEGKKYADRLKAAGVSVVYEEFKGMIHGFFQMPKLLKKSRLAHALLASELRTVFGVDGKVMKKKSLANS